MHQLTCQKKKLTTRLIRTHAGNPRWRKWYDWIGTVDLRSILSLHVLLFLRNKNLKKKKFLCMSQEEDLFVGAGVVFDGGGLGWWVGCWCELEKCQWRCGITQLVEGRGGWVPPKALFLLSSTLVWLIVKAVCEETRVKVGAGKTTRFVTGRRAGVVVEANQMISYTTAFSLKKKKRVCWDKKSRTEGCSEGRSLVSSPISQIGWFIKCKKCNKVAWLSCNERGC